MGGADISQPRQDSHPRDWGSGVPIRPSQARFLPESVSTHSSPLVIHVAPLSLLWWATDWESHPWSGAVGLRPGEPPHSTRACSRQHQWPWTLCARRRPGGHAVLRSYEASRGILVCSIEGSLGSSIAHFNVLTRERQHLAALQSVASPRLIQGPSVSDFGEVRLFPWLAHLWKEVSAEKGEPADTPALLLSLKEPTK